MTKARDTANLISGGTVVMNNLTVAGTTNLQGTIRSNGFGHDNARFSAGLFGTKLDYDAQSANFTAAKTLTGGTSGATAIIGSDSDAGTTGTLTLSSFTDHFDENETITDNNSSPGSATANGTSYFPVADNTLTVVPWDNEFEDQLGTHAAGEWTVTSLPACTMYYRITIAFEIENSNTKSLTVQLEKEISSAWSVVEQATQTVDVTSAWDVPHSVTLVGFYEMPTTVTKFRVRVKSVDSGAVAAKLRGADDSCVIDMYPVLL